MPVPTILKRWALKYFSDPEAIILVVLLTAGFGVVILFGNMLMPVFASIVIAYLLESIVAWLTRHRVARPLAVAFVFTLFMAFLLFLVLGLVPLLSKQLTQLVQELPKMIGQGQELLRLLPERYPKFFTEDQVVELNTAIRAWVTTFGQRLVSVSLASISHFFTLVVYLILMPVMVFFFLKDKTQMQEMVHRFMPPERGVALRVWHEMDQQIGNYIRGKFTEISLVGIATFFVFGALELKYAMLLGALVGLSVVVPYVGAIAVTFPVAIVAYYQWGISPDFAYLLGAYLLVQIIDGNVVVPWLFSEAVNLHPVAIIVAVLLFGGMWGFWGVFFAIPLATLVKAVVNAWPRAQVDGGEADNEEHPVSLAGGGS